MNKITNEELDGLIKSAVNSSGPLPPDDKFSKIILALRELRELRCSMLKAQPVSEPYKLPVGYFSYGSECGFDWHNTEKEAIEAAEAVIDNYRGDACDGWSEETDSVCWGVILQQATKVDERPRTDDDKCDPAIDTVCDYALLPVREG